MKIIFHGVGAATNQSMDNTYFLIEDLDNKLQVDCGGGLGLMHLVKSGKIKFNDLFITHKHTDHILGFFKLSRTIRLGANIEKLNVFCSKNVEKSIIKVVDILEIFRTKKSINSGVIKFNNISDRKKFNIGEFEITPINLNSEKIEQFGFYLKYKNKSILFFGDEAVKILDRNDLEEFYGADYLICEGLNPEFMNIDFGGEINNKGIFHITARESGKIATKLKVKNLVIVHTREQIPGGRVTELRKDAALEFSGNIIVPEEGDILELN